MFSQRSNPGISRIVNTCSRDSGAGGACRSVKVIRLSDSERNLAQSLIDSSGKPFSPLVELAGECRIRFKVPDPVHANRCHVLGQGWGSGGGDVWRVPETIALTYPVCSRRGCSSSIGEGVCNPHSVCRSYRLLKETYRRRVTRSQEIDYTVVGDRG